MLYASGLTGMDMHSLKLVEGGVAEETTQALLNLQEIMAAAGGSLHSVAACSVSMRNISKDFGTMNRAYAAFWPEAPPSRVAVQVAALAGNASVEIQCTAALPGYERSVVNVPGLPDLKGFPLSWAIKASDMVYASGMQGFDLATQKLVPGGAGAQTTKALENIEAILKAGGSGLDRVVSCEVSLKDMADFKAVNEAYAALWPQSGFPSRIAVQVAGLAGAGDMEVRCHGAGAGTKVQVVLVPSWSIKSFPLSPGVLAGDVVYASGMVGMDMATMKIVPGGIGAETSQALENVKAVFGAAGARLEDALICEVTLKDMRDFQAMNAAYARFWPKDPPARITVQAARLAQDESVEIRCLGTVGGPSEFVVI